MINETQGQRPWSQQPWNDLSNDLQSLQMLLESRWLETIEVFSMLTKVHILMQLSVPV